MNDPVLIFDSDIDLAYMLQEQIKRYHARKIYICTNKDIISDPHSLAAFAYIFLDSKIMLDIKETVLNELRVACAKSTIVLLSDDYSHSLRLLQSNLGAQWILQKPIVTEDLQKIFPSGKDRKDDLKLGEPL